MNEELAEIERKIDDAVASGRMFPRGCTVVAGFSGGADSVVLTDYLFRRAEDYGISVAAAHVNHCLRGAESDSDEAFVRDFCAARGIPLHVLRADVRSLARQQSLGLEECGRGVRYSYFRSLCGENGRIATAHTLTDSTETVLMNLAKGAGPRGLSGIPAVRGNIVRPLIGLTRAEVELCCRLRGLSFVTDSSNLSADFARNRLRLRAVPVFREINPEFEHAVGRAAEILRRDEDYLESLAREALEGAALPDGGYRLAVLQKLPDPVLLRAAALAIGAVSQGRPGMANLEAAARVVRDGAGAVTAAGAVRCSASGGVFRAETAAAPAPEPEWSVPLTPSGALLPGGRRLLLRPAAREEAENAKINNLLFNNFACYDTIIINSCLVRNRRAGDAYRPAGRGVTKTLKQLFCENSVPVRERSRRAILVCGGKIAWAEGFGAAEEFRVRPEGKICEIIVKECGEP